jgi:hypothetical protein
VSRFEVSIRSRTSDELPAAGALSSTPPTAVALSSTPPVALSSTPPVRVVTREQSGSGER